MKFTKQPSVQITLDPIPFTLKDWVDTTNALKMKYLSEHPEILQEMAQAGMSLPQAVLHALRLENSYCATNRTAMRMSMAKFPDQGATLESFDFSCSLLDESTIRGLAKCDWIDAHQNLLFYGESGLGKTHLAIALGKKAIEQKGYSVLFISANELMDKLEAARKQGKVEAELTKLNRADLIIVDEFGYPLMADQPTNSSLFYAFISSRYEKRSTIITTNRKIRDWPKYLNNDAQACQACLDRFLHHSIRVCFRGESYRVTEIRMERLSTDADAEKFSKSLLPE